MVNLLYRQQLGADVRDNNTSTWSTQGRLPLSSVAVLLPCVEGTIERIRRAFNISRSIVVCVSRVIRADGGVSIKETGDWPDCSLPQEEIRSSDCFDPINHASRR